MTRTHWTYSFKLAEAGQSDLYFDSEISAYHAAFQAYWDACEEGHSFKEKQSSEVWLSEVIRHDDQENEIIQTKELMCYYHYVKPDREEHGTWSAR